MIPISSKSDHIKGVNGQFCDKFSKTREIQKIEIFYSAGNGINSYEPDRAC